MKSRNRQLIKIIDTAINKLMQYIDDTDIIIDNNGRLGCGAFGAVYKAICKNEIVAAKTFKSQAQNTDELSTLCSSKCQSPYALHIIGVANLNTNEPKFVLQYMDGGDLRGHLDKRRNNEVTVTNYSRMEIAWAIANVLADIHHYGCIHHDIKIHNVLLSTKHYTKKLVDLGQTRDIATTMTQGAGTLYCTAPEVLKGGHYGVQADIYSFGFVLTELDILLVPFSCNSKQSE
ncbi:kinase [Thraustotheca clavata]|uniref:Kinase n=1 Tax=Thraustotheca clavata TaxID=74557 RepID=A0A1V9YMD7_9STRA|nr:kinase [Thraustotheca clavata]